MFGHVALIATEPNLFSSSSASAQHFFLDPVYMCLQILINFLNYLVPNNCIIFKQTRMGSVHSGPQNSCLLVYLILFLHVCLLMQNYQSQIMKLGEKLSRIIFHCFFIFVNFLKMKFLIFLQISGLEYRIRQQITNCKHESSQTLNL